MALRRVYWHVTQHGRREVVDADLRDYFNSIPHAPLMRSLSRRIADGRLLHVIKRWLTAPVVEVIDGRSVQTAEARRTKRGTPQGGVISPLLANCYFRRFLLAWHDHGHRDRLDAHVVNYADDFVICCRPGNAPAAMARMATLMTRLGLEVNAKKTRIARLPEESFDFLGYTVGRFHGKNGRPYIGTRPSRKSVKSLLRRIHQRTTRQWYADDPKSTVARISSMLRGWCGYLTRGRSSRSTTSSTDTPSDESVAGCYGDRDAKAPGSTRSRTSIFMRRSASTPSRETAATCQERRFDGTGESRMREIRTSGLTSGDWKRSHGPN
jgi:group II intron reverse transcriptase/maturase